MIFTDIHNHYNDIWVKWIGLYFEIQYNQKIEKYVQYVQVEFEATYISFYCKCHGSFENVSIPMI